MHKLDFNIGAQVHCKDGPCGRVLKVVVDPHTLRAMGLVVEKGLLLKTDRVLPVSATDTLADGDIYLSIAGEELACFPEYREEEFRVQAFDAREGEEYQAEQTLQWIGPYGLAAAERPIPMIRQRIHEGVSPEQAVVGRGTVVNDWDGVPLGRVDHVLVDRKSRQITHLVVERGLFSHSIVVPVSMVKRVNKDGIAVRAAEDTLEYLPRYAARDQADIWAELQDRLDAAVMNLSGIKANVERGVVHLSGVVRDVMAKRYAEAAARSIEGVVDVENALNSDTAIWANVSAALMADPRTGIALIEVISERGIVTLKGQVNSTNIRDAAEDIASHQPGVKGVIVGLKVEPDDYSRAVAPGLMTSAVFTSK